MDYELCLKLKESGFPQPDPLKKAVEDAPFHDFEEGRDPIYIPTLSELIENFGDRTLIISRYSESAGGITHVRYGEWEAEDKSMAIALANLWLELNKKNAPQT